MYSNGGPYSHISRIPGREITDHIARDETRCRLWNISHLLRAWFSLYGRLQIFSRPKSSVTFKNKNVNATNCQHRCRFDVTYQILGQGHGIPYRLPVAYRGGWGVQNPQIPKAPKLCQNQQNCENC